MSQNEQGKVQGRIRYQIKREQNYSYIIIFNIYFFELTGCNKFLYLKISLDPHIAKN